MNANVEKYILASEEELGAVAALDVPASRGWDVPPQLASAAYENRGKSLAY
jgi:hypothetical protein